MPNRRHAGATHLGALSGDDEDSWNPWLLGDDYAAPAYTRCKSDVIEEHEPCTPSPKNNLQGGPSPTLSPQLFRCHQAALPAAETSPIFPPLRSGNFPNLSKSGFSKYIVNKFKLQSSFNLLGLQNQ